PATLPASVARPQESRMRSRPFGRSGHTVGEIGFGAWAIGAAWGTVDDRDSIAALHAALDAGLDFIDTADVYGDGHSERLIARVLKERGGKRPFVATRPGAACPGRKWPATPRRTCRSGWTAAAATWRWKPSTCCCCSARRPTTTTIRRS